MKTLSILLLAVAATAINTQAQYFNFKKKTKEDEVEKTLPASLLTEWQKTHNRQIMFFDNWLGARLDESDADATTTIELGDDFWLRSYFEPADKPTHPLDLRLSCDGVSLSMLDIWKYSKANYASSNGILPAYDQLVTPDADNWWKNANVWSMCGTAKSEDFEKAGSPGYGCMYNSYPTECLLRMFFAKINDKIVNGATLAVKFELLEKSDAMYYEPTGTWTTVSEGTLNFHVGDKAKALNNYYYGFMASGLDDAKAEEAIKSAILAKSNAVISEVYKVDIVSTDYNYYKNDYGTPIYRWVTARIMFKSKTDGYVFTGTVNASFNYNGTGYDTNPTDLFYQCGIAAVYTLAVPKS